MSPPIQAAEDDWQLSSSASGASSNYANSLLLKNQSSEGIRISGDYKDQWGVSAGLLSTQVNVQAITQLNAQAQTSLLISGHINQPSSFSPGRWTAQLDAYEIHSNAPTDPMHGDSNGVSAVVPQIIWTSFSHPLKFDVSYGASNFKNNSTVNQTSAGLGIGTNDQKYWLQMRTYFLNNLNPTASMGRSQTQSASLQVTRVLNPSWSWAPSSLSAGIERGSKIYHIDMQTQSLYNLPMLSQGGENIALSWKITPKTNLAIQLSNVRYFSDSYYIANKFTMTTLGSQISWSW